MALKDLLALVDVKLKDVFHKVTYDPTKDRARMVKRIDDTKGKFLAVERPRGKVDFDARNGVVEYRPTLPGGGPLLIEKSDVSYVPAERFSDFLDILRAEVSEGRMDKEIEAAASGDAVVSEKPKRQRAASTGERQGWSEERKRKFSESIEKRRAAKAAATGA
jgi:hypothetical protein